MKNPHDNPRLDDRFKTLAVRVRLGIKRKQAVIGKHRLLPLCKRENVSLVWASDSLSNHALGKLKLECQKYNIPLLLFGSPEHIGEATGEPSAKVYILKKSFSGIGQILAEFCEFFQK